MRDLVASHGCRANDWDGEGAQGDGQIAASACDFDEAYPREKEPSPWQPSVRWRDIFVVIERPV